MPTVTCRDCRTKNLPDAGVCSQCGVDVPIFEYPLYYSVMGATAAAFLLGPSILLFAGFNGHNLDQYKHLAVGLVATGLTLLLVPYTPTLLVLGLIIAKKQLVFPAGRAILHGLTIGAPLAIAMVILFFTIVEIHPPAGSQGPARSEQVQYL